MNHGTLVRGMEALLPMPRIPPVRSWRVSYQRSVNPPGHTRTRVSTTDGTENTDGSRWIEAPICFNVERRPGSLLAAASIIRAIGAIRGPIHREGPGHGFCGPGNASFS